MTKHKLNIIIDIVAFISFTMLTTTGVLMHYSLPPGSGSFATVLGLDRHDWGAIHFWIAMAFFGTIALHLVLHWKWIASVVQGRKGTGSHGRRVALAAIGLLAFVALAASPLLVPIEQTGQSAGRHGGQTDEDTMIRGSQTLSEVAAAVDMPVEELISQLGLPSDVEQDERLGRLSRSHDISIAKVRQVVEEFKSRR